MRLWKSAALVVLGTLYMVLGPTRTFAADEFSVDTTVTYSVQESGKTVITHDVTLENNFSDLYATTYTLSLENIDAANVSARSSSGSNFPVEIQKDGDITNIKVSFTDTSVGKGVQRHFSITYENASFAVRTGEVWEISIPRLGGGSNFRSYQLVLQIPKSFGLEAYISPTPVTKEQTDTGYTYTFNKNSLTQTGVTAAYGQFQVFSFNLSYHLENPLTRGSSTEIALPPDTAFQKVYIQKIEPKPSNVTVDQDGNWIATYDLSSRQRIDVTVTGAVQIFASYRSFAKATNKEINADLAATEYWQVDDPKIQALARELKTPKAIYDYVSQNLHYDTNRVQPNVQRMGAVAALENPSQAICMEFTDLFIAISRAAGIPAREINGYAYTENPEVEPLGLVADVLHSWPEYYDKEKSVWVPVDPTWGSTTGGVDFFNKLDLRHFAFVIHGQSSREPYPPGSYKLGPNPQKDVFVSFGQLPDNRITIPKMSIAPYRVLPFFSSIYTVTISNPGPAALYSIYPTIYYDSVENARQEIDVLPPYSNHQIQVTLRHNFLGKDMPSVIKVSVGGSDAQILTNKKQIVVNSLAVFAVFLLIIMLVIFLRVKKVKIFALFAKIGSLRKIDNDKPGSQTREDQIKT